MTAHRSTYRRPSVWRAIISAGLVPATLVLSFVAVLAVALMVAR